MPSCFWRVPGARRAPALIVAAFAVMLVATGAGRAAGDSNEVNVYTYREAKLMAPLFEASPAPDARPSFAVNAAFEPSLCTRRSPFPGNGILRPETNRRNRHPTSG